MSSQEKKLSEALGRAFKISQKYSSLSDGIIVNADEAETKFVVDVQIDEATTYFGVPLKVVKGSRASIIEIPELNSNCIISFRDANQGRPQIIFLDRVAKVFVNCNSYIFNEGNFGGLVKVEPLTEKINRIEEDLNKIKEAFASWTPISETGLKTASLEWSAEILTPTNREEIEDENVRH